jgi:hypothetical protein
MAAKKLFFLGLDSLGDQADRKQGSQCFSDTFSGGNGCYEAEQS